MSSMSRRRFLELTGGATALAFAGSPMRALAAGQRIVVVGGGAGGTIAARHLKMADPSIEVTLIEKGEVHYAPYMSNEILSGTRIIDSIRFEYHGIEKQGIKVVHDTVTRIDPVKQAVYSQGGETFGYDRLIVSPGIALREGVIEGYDAAASTKMPHAYGQFMGDGQQIVVLRNQLEAMKRGGVVIIAVPAEPYRCPPAPYERASQIAAYLKKQNSTAKVVILDAKDEFPRQKLFIDAWQELYPGMIEWVKGSDTQGGVKRVDPKTMTVYTGVDQRKADVVNIVPPQKAGTIAQQADLTDGSGWCPVDLRTFESKRHKGVHVIGDACQAADLTKTAQSANSQGKVCAAAMVALLAGREPVVARYVDLDYNIIAPDYAIVYAAVYRLSQGGDRIVRISGGHSTPAKPMAEHRKREVTYAHSWYKNITDEMFG